METEEEKANAELYENHPQDSRVVGPLETASTISRKAGTGGGNVDIVCHQQGCDVYNGTIQGDVATMVTSRVGVPADTGAKILMNKEPIFLKYKQSSKSEKPWSEDGAAQSLSAGCHDASVMIRRRVRRLIPLECERLMGYPEFYTQIPWRKKPAEDCPDSHRYEACGNGWAINCARWVLLGIHRYLESLDDEQYGESK